MGVGLVVGLVVLLASWSMERNVCLPGIAASASCRRAWLGVMGVRATVRVRVRDRVRVRAKLELGLGLRLGLGLGLAPPLWFSPPGRKLSAMEVQVGGKTPGAYWQVVPFSAASFTLLEVLTYTPT